MEALFAESQRLNPQFNPESSQYHSHADSTHGAPHIDSTDVIPSTSTSRRTETSFIWTYYKKIPVPNTTNQFKCVCLPCQRDNKVKEYSWRTGSGYGSMSRHLQSAHGNSETHKSGAGTSQPGGGQTQLSGFMSSQPSGGRVFNQYFSNSSRLATMHYRTFLKELFQSATVENQIR